VVFSRSGLWLSPFRGFCVPIGLVCCMIPGLYEVIQYTPPLSSVKLPTPPRAAPPPPPVPSLPRHRH